MGVKSDSSESDDDNKHVNYSYDRGIDFVEIRDKLIREFNINYDNYISKNKFIYTNHRLAYITIELIQLINGSRISEAIKAFKTFGEFGVSKMATTKISKSAGIKYLLNPVSGKREPKMCKAKYRKMKFPSDWIKDKVPDISAFMNSLWHNNSDLCENTMLKKNICTWMIRKFQCNTHSLRYALINHLLYDRKLKMSAVAKYVGHSNVQQLVTYTQQKNCDKIFDLDL